MHGEQIRLIAGLGNPGEEYSRTRHNAGFMAIDHLGSEFSIDLSKKKFDANFGRGRIKQKDIILVKPLSYMNRSGMPLGRLADYFRILSEEILVIHDDIDLAFGRIKIKEKGGHGGHKGIKSIMEILGRDDFTRLRVGVGRSGAGKGVVGHVLGKFDSEEAGELPEIIERSRDAVVTILCKGVKAGMNKFNVKK